jgi:hypothetical protein
MTLPEKLREGLADPKTSLHAVELTPEVRERLQRACSELIDELVKRTKNPFEAYMVLHFLMETFEKKYDIHGGFTVEHEDKSAS